MFIYIFIRCPIGMGFIYPNNSRDVYLYIYSVSYRYGIDRRKLEKNTGLPILWIPL